MFKSGDNKKIGEYLSTLINAKYPSDRKFCKAYIEAAGGVVNDDELRKMANRISQIKKGGNAIQPYDFPIFTELLEVTCEELLSAGRCFVPKRNRVTNYSVAFSKDEKEWDKFINREDKLILNPDEYGKNAIDYAIDFKNYTFLKFLMDHKYIWFDGRKDDDYWMTFGAGTSIKRRDVHNIDSYLHNKIAEEDKLRMDMIFLAIENDDLKMLTDLRARELPEMYHRTHYINCPPPDFDIRFDEKLVRDISSASDKILNYFTDEFEIRDHIKYKDASKRVHKFMFPFISQVLDFAIENNHPFAEFALKKSIKHNQETYDKLKQLIENSIKTEVERSSFQGEEYLNSLKPNTIKWILDGFDFYENGNIVSFFDRTHVTGIITNIAHTSKSSEDVKINHLINELNDLYEKIRGIKEQKYE